MLQHLTKVPANFAGNGDSKNKENERYTFLHLYPDMHFNYMSAHFCLEVSQLSLSIDSIHNLVGFLFFASDEKG